MFKTFKKRIFQILLKNTKKYLKETELDFSNIFQLQYEIQSQVNILRETNHKLH